jgi:hypothetical protein
MARSIAYLLTALPMWLLTTTPAHAQAAVEAGLGAGRAATSAAPAKGIGKAMSGLAGKLGETLKAGQPTSGASTTVTTVAVSSPSAKDAPKPAANWEDPSGIEPGLSYADLVRRFGPPTLEITGEGGKSLTYARKSGAFQLEIRDDKVSSIDKPKS